MPLSLEQSETSSFLRDFKPLMPLGILLRFFKRKKDAGGCLIEVPLASNSSKLSTFPKFSGMFLSSEQSETSSFLRDFKPLMLLGILSRFLQLLMFNRTKPAKRLKDEVSSKRSSLKQFMFPTIPGNLSSFEQPLRVQAFNDSISRLLGRVLRLMQLTRFTN
uniref:Uncharacterized protein n=1 Tax=Salix viminalis TaxID=40686 RepID=A0A6N2LVA6_SALVM